MQLKTRCIQPTTNTGIIDTSIFGAQTRVRVESNVSCLDWELTDEELQELDRAIAAAMG